MEITWNKGRLSPKRMEMIYSFWLESSDICTFRTWLKRHTFFSDYQINRLYRFSKTDTAASICHSHAFD